jgi:hypothetical protein
MKEKKHWCLLVFLHMDVYHIVRATHYCHLWVAEEWTLLIMDGTKDNMQLMGGNGSAPFSESSTSFKR